MRSTVTSRQSVSPAGVPPFQVPLTNPSRLVCTPAILGLASTTGMCSTVYGKEMLHVDCGSELLSSTGSRGTKERLPVAATSMLTSKIVGHPPEP